jgi:hypothetical protein
VTYIQVNGYVCPRCRRRWWEFRVGPRKCPACGYECDFSFGGKDDVMKYAMPFNLDVSDGRLVVMQEEEA